MREKNRWNKKYKSKVFKLTIIPKKVKKSSFYSDIGAFVMVQDISFAMRQQQELLGKMYQEAILTNYSHEQMTPLNCIITNS